MDNIGKIRLNELEYGTVFVVNLNEYPLLALDEYQDDYRAFTYLKGDSKGEILYMASDNFVIVLKEIQKAEYKAVQS